MEGWIKIGVQCASAPRGANSFLLELTPTEIGGKNNRVASPVSIPIHPSTFIRGIWQ